MVEDIGDDKKKRHNKRAAGRKADKKSKKNPHVQELTAKQRNPRAFTVRSSVKAAKSVHRTEDLKQRKIHIPIVDRTALEPPPIVVAIVGPPQVGKSTLLRCLVRNFTRQTLTSVRGPVTIVSGKKRRITLIECNNDINSMIDISKVADLVLLMVDASFGFEMETFEFLNICQVHGFPRVMGVLTHLDMFRDNKKLRKIKKTLKHRFWTDVYPGAKLFYLSGMVHSDYQRMEVHNLGRFISVMKFRPLDWRQNHPYLLIDRVEDVTPPEVIRQQPLCDRRVCLYGYVRGVPLRADTPLHLAGAGDYRLAAIDFLADPCPLPERNNMRKSRRSLNEQERLLYAPMSGVGGIVYDKDAVYIDLKGSHSHADKRAGDESAEEEDEVDEESQLKNTLKESRATLDQMMDTAELRVLSGERPLVSGEVRRQQELQEHEVTDEDRADSDLNGRQFEQVEQGGRTRRRVLFKDSGGDVESDSDSDTGDLGDDQHSSIPVASVPPESVSSSSSGGDSVFTEFGFKQTARQLSRLIYDQSTCVVASDRQQDADEEELGGLFRRRGRSILGGGGGGAGIRDTEVYQWRPLCAIDWSQPDKRRLLAGRFICVEGDQSERAAALLAMEHQDDGDDDDGDSDLDGDFEDLETGEVHTAKKRTRPEDENSRAEDEEEGDSATEEQLPVKAEEEQLTRKQRIERKKKLKMAFDSEYDDKEASGFYDDLKRDVDQQARLNCSEFDALEDRERVRFEGYRAGMYVRLELADVPCELIVHMDASYPLVLGGLSAGEQTVGYLQARFKRHRWFTRTLKSRDPITVSVGWRRFQTVPVYSAQDHNGRHRLLKYTPDHLHCTAHFFGPLTPQGSGVLAVATDSDAAAEKRDAAFRVTATGVLLDLDKTVRIHKKLKLVGEPQSVAGKTAFVGGMFGSAVEAARFEGALCRTVSGVRGHVKRAIAGQAGVVRCTFEDTVRRSDLVFVRTWCPVPVPKLYAPVCSLLLPASARSSGWPAMKTLAQLKRERGLRIDANTDHLYTPVVRHAKPPAPPLHVPTQLLKQLPYADKVKLAGGGSEDAAAKKTPRLVRRRDGSLVAPSVSRQPLAVVLQPHEQKVQRLMATVQAAHELQEERRQAVGRERAAVMVQRHQQRVSKFEQRQKRVRKHLFRVLGRQKRAAGGKHED